LPLTDPFVVATGSRTTAENVFVRLTLQDGACGYGEIAPFPEVGGEDRATSLRAAIPLAESLLSRPASEYRALGQLLDERAPSCPAARCGLETALLDAYCRSQRVPLWKLWGGADVRPRETDITVPIADEAQTVALARGWRAKGFRLFKMKIGKDVDGDIRRLEAVHRALPGVAFIGDGNQGYDRAACLAFVDGVQRFGGNLVLLEQPVSRGDLDGLAAVRRLSGIPVAADESVRSLADAARVVEAGAADYLNIKIMKTGVMEAWDIADFATANGLRLMIGGMVETRIAMACSFAMVLGLGGFDVLDLDTPLLMAEDPVTGGYRYDGPMLHPWNGSGMELSVSPPADAIVIA
jgi:L-alanine-DL-glutamate epimerase-like enolase superfamily enzyme